MAYFTLAVFALIVVGGTLAVSFAFIYALYLKFIMGDERSLSEIFWEL